MSKIKRVISPIDRILPEEIKGYDSLAELALNMRWSWNHATDHIWRVFDPALWELTHNPYPQMIALARRLKEQYGLKIIVVSNEGRGLNEYRIQKFKLDDFVDSFISSCYVHLRKADAGIFRLALDTANKK